jgi:hypothetical protein
MNRKQSFSSKYPVLVVCLMCLFSVPMSAQTVAKGEFDLPCAAKWGLADLPAGHYTFLLDSTAKQGKLVIRGAKSSPFIRASVVDDHNPVDRNELILIRSGRTGIVRALRLADLGITFYYAMPGSARFYADNKPELIQRAPVTISGK